MAGRIRTFKPEFYQHEGLQELEADNAGKYPMFVYQGLWMLCDMQGVFPWKPKTIKIHVLPFLDFDMVYTLNLLKEHGYVVLFRADDGLDYGYIPTFRKHQVLQTKEVLAGAKYPRYEQETEQYRNSTETVPKLQEGKGREGKGREGKGSAHEKNVLNFSSHRNENPKDEISKEKEPPRNLDSGDFVQEQTHIRLAEVLEHTLERFPANVAELIRHLGVGSTKEELSALIKKYAAHHFGKNANPTLTLASHFANLSKWASTEKGFKRPKSETKQTIVMAPQPFVL